MVSLFLYGDYVRNYDPEELHLFLTATNNYMTNIKHKDTNLFHKIICHNLMLWLSMKYQDV